MLRAFALSVAQLREPVHRGVLWRALAGTVLLFGALGWGCEAALSHLDTSGWPDWLADAWHGGGPVFGALLILPLLLPLFAAFATGIAELWLDDIVGAVEAKYYPASAAKAAGWATSLRLGLGATLRLLLWNIVALPFYVALLFTGVGTLALFIVVNGWLLGRSYLEMVAARHLPAAAIAPWIAAHRSARWQTGLLTAALFAVPVVNLAAPLIGSGIATHMFHRLRKPR